MIKLISMRRCFKLMMKIVLEKLRISDEFFNDDNDDDSVVVLVPPLPDDILIDILIRLPAEEVLECRRVCKHWNALTSTPHFTKKHLKVNADAAEPSIIIYLERLHFGEGGFREVCVFLFNEWGAATIKPTNKIKRLSVKSIYPELIYKNNVKGMRYYEDHGVLNFIPRKFPGVVPGVVPSMKSSFILYNPVTQQQMVLHTKLGSICAYFYHSVADEYRVLWYRRSNGVKVEYQILCLGSPVDKPSWRRLPDFDFAPFGRAIRTCYLNNEILHWGSTGRNGTTECNTCLIMFDINKEEFSSMPHPGKLCTATGACRRYKRMFLLELKSRDDSLLCLCDCSAQDRIDMWVLEDIQKQTWVKRHRIILDFAIYRSQDIDHSNILINPFGLLNDELLFDKDKLGVFVYNTSTRTLRRIIEMLDGSFDFTNNIDYIRDIGLFHKSLVSFTNFKGQHLIMEPY